MFAHYSEVYSYCVKMFEPMEVLKPNVIFDHFIFSQIEGPSVALSGIWVFYLEFSYVGLLWFVYLVLVLSFISMVETDLFSVVSFDWNSVIFTDVASHLSRDQPSWQSASLNCSIVDLVWFVQYVRLRFIFIIQKHCILAKIQLELVVVGLGRHRNCGTCQNQ